MARARCKAGVQKGVVGTAANLKAHALASGVASTQIHSPVAMRGYGPGLPDLLLRPEFQIFNVVSPKF